MKREIITTPVVPKRKANVPPFPEALDVVLYSDSAKDVVFHANGSKFMHRVANDEWVRIYGLTKMMFHAFWPEYDRNDPSILRKEKENRTKHSALKRKQRQRETAARRRGKSGWRGRRGGRYRRTMRRGRGGAGKTTTTYSDADMVEMQKQRPTDSKTGADLGELVHMQLVVWSKTRHLGIPLDTPTMVPPWQMHSQQAVDELIRNVGVDVRFGEFLIYDPAVPVATSVDLLGWLPKPSPADLERFVTVNKEMPYITRERGNPRTLVIIEVKTGSSYNMNLGNARMHGHAAGEMGLINSPLNQAMTQLAISRAIIERRYTAAIDPERQGSRIGGGGREHQQRRIKVLGLLVWVNRSTGARSRWLTPMWEEAGRIMLGELRAHMAKRDGKAWKQKKTYGK